MDAKSIAGQIKTLFPNFSKPKLLEEIISKSRWMAVNRGKQILDIGSEVTIVPLVISGSIKVIREDEEGNEIFLYYIKAGESCAMTLTSCMRREKSSIKAIVEHPASVLAVPVEVVLDLAHRYSTWNDFITETYAYRFEELLEVIDNVAFYKLDVRLLKYLIDKSLLLGNKTLTVSRTDIAKDLNSSREVISRLLKQMEKNRLIHIDGNQVELLET